MAPEHGDGGEMNFSLYLMHVWLSKLDQHVVQGEAVLLAEVIWK
jgi:hypothetical protein